MRLSWKLFFIITPLFILFLTVFGTWMIQDGFQSSLEKEVDRCTIENQMFETSYELVRHGLSEEQLAGTAERMLVETFHRVNSVDEGCARIYDKNMQVLYEDNELRIDHDIKEQLEEEEAGNTGWKIARQGEQYYVVVLGKGPDDRWIETIQNITGIFQDRQSRYTTYRISMLAVSFLVGCLIFLVLLVVMRNTQKLSRATRQFARGKYDAKVKIHSSDEIGKLAEDFNWMTTTINQQMNQLQNEVERQEAFTSAFAHELKTPLTSIIGYADTLRSMELSREEMDMCADYIYHQGKRLQSLSYKLLDMAMLDKITTEFQLISMEELFAEVERTIKPVLKESEIRLLSKALKGNVRGDRDLLGSLLLNLIDNARKASEPGSRIWLMGRKVKDRYEIIVKDEGKGIPAKELERITEAFYMVDKSRSRKEGGAGLGLALCQKILELHGGTWKMSSTPGKGLEVILWLPVIRQQKKGNEHDASST